jgi:hypothetical protein
VMVGNLENKQKDTKCKDFLMRLIL